MTDLHEENADLAMLDSMRKKVLWSYLISLGLIIVGFFCFFVNTPIAVGLFVAGIIVMLITGISIQKKYTRAFKSTFVEQTLKQYFDNVKFEPKRGIDKSIIRDTEMIRMGNRYSSDDFLTASYKGINFLQADLCIEEHHSSGDHSYTETIFKGRWMIFDFNKNFSCNMQVREKGFTSAKLGGGFWGTKNAMHRVTMEDVEFEKMFDVFTQEDHEAFYVMTPHMMQNLKQLRSSTKGAIMLCFIGGQMHVAVNSGKNAFEAPIFRSIDSERIQNEIAADISVITRFVDELNLDRNIFK